MTPAILAAGIELAELGWPVFPIKPRDKVPMTRHGVKDATTDHQKITRWFRRYPEANLAVATGAPGPDVLDIDNPHEPAAKPALNLLELLKPPRVATPRGGHGYFQGTTGGTITLPYGEIRRVGSYVVVPPSIHPSGKVYIWLDPPTRPLPRLPDQIVGARRTAGAGNLEIPNLIPLGGRHDALKDMAVRFLRAGITDPATLEGMLADFFNRRCDPDPPPRKNEFHQLAVWAAKTNLANRERDAETHPPLLPKKAKKSSKKRELDKAPDGDATLAEHRAYIAAAGGLPDPVDIKNVRRYGTAGTDRLSIELSNGQRIVFPRQDHVSHTQWAKTVIMATNGIADPASLTAWEASKVLRSLCILADAPPEEREAENLQNQLDDLLTITEPLEPHNFSESDGRYHATMQCRGRGVWDPRERDTDKRPALLVDQDGRRYLRASELQNFLNWRGLGIGTHQLQGQMAMIGAEYVALNGREPASPDNPRRRTARMVLYRLAEEEAE